jgi:hypothetical protein
VVVGFRGILTCSSQVISDGSYDQNRDFTISAQRTSQREGKDQFVYGETEGCSYPYTRPLTVRVKLLSLNGTAVG